MNVLFNNILLSAKWENNKDERTINQNQCQYIEGQTKSQKVLPMKNKLVFTSASLSQPQIALIFVAKECQLDSEDLRPRITAWKMESNKPK